jgi:hypothetical protein
MSFEIETHFSESPHSLLHFFILHFTTDYFLGPPRSIRAMPRPPRSSRNLPTPNYLDRIQSYITNEPSKEDLVGAQHYSPYAISILRFTACALLSNYILSQTLSTGALVTNFYSKQVHFYFTSYLSELLLPTRYSDDFKNAGLGFTTLRVISYLRALASAGISMGLTGLPQMVLCAFSLAGYVATIVHERR